MTSAQSRTRALLAAARSRLTRLLHSAPGRHPLAQQPDTTDNSNTASEASTRTRLPAPGRATEPVPADDLREPVTTSHSGPDQAEASIRTRLRQLGVRP